VLTGLSPIVEAVRGDFVIAGRADLPVKSFKEFLAYAKANPRKLAYGTPGAGTSPHILMEHLSSVTGAELLHVPFTGTAAALTALLEGSIQVIDTPILILKAHIDSGKLIPWAISSAKRSPLLPNVPTVMESGVPDFNVPYWTGFFAPPKTPPQVIARLNAAFVRTLARPDVIEKFNAMGMSTHGGSAADFNTMLRGELTTWKKLVTSRNLTMN